MPSVSYNLITQITARFITQFLRNAFVETRSAIVSRVEPWLLNIVPDWVATGRRAETMRIITHVIPAKIGLICVLLCGVAQGQQFFDDFNRPDGPVGNGWGAWNGSSLSTGQLVTFGSDGAGGGVYRSFAVTFPATFAFDFRTQSPHPSCDVGN